MALLSLITNVPLFADLSAEELAPLATACQLHTYPPETLLFAMNDPAQSCFYLYQGQVKLCRINREGKEKVIEIIKEGQTFAEAMVFLQQPYPVSAQALEWVKVLEIPARALLDLLRQQPDIALKLLASLSKRLHGLVQDIEQLSLANAQQRLAGFLLSFGEEQFQLPAAKIVLASRLGLTPEHFSRTLSYFKAQGVIAEQGGSVRILNRLALQQQND